MDLSIDIIKPLKGLQENARQLHRESDFREGYLMAIQHAIELGEVMQAQINNRLAWK